MEEYTFEILAHDTDAYWKTVELRDEILRKPLNLKFTKEQLAAEHDQVHIAIQVGDELKGCLVLQDHGDETMQMRQVAVKEHLQRSGIGTLLCQYAEQYSAKRGKKLIYCHARDVAVPFYEKLGWRVRGDEFTEVSIKHFVMEKSLVDQS